MKRALLVVSVGTTVPEADQSCIRPIEHALQIAFPDRRVFRAFTSGIIRRKLLAQGTHIASPEEALLRLTEEGYDDITILPTHFLPGTEFENLRAVSGDHRILEPLLSSENDLEWMAGLLSSIHQREGIPLLLGGHGSDHGADRIYAQLSSKLPEKVFLACLKGNLTLNRFLPHLDALPEKEILLLPLMLAAGKHARDELTEWKDILEARGMHVRICMQGLGELPAVRQRFVDKVRSMQ